MTELLFRPASDASWSLARSSLAATHDAKSGRESNSSTTAEDWFAHEARDHMSPDRTHDDENSRQPETIDRPARNRADA